MMLNAGVVGLGRWGQTLIRSVQGKSDRIRVLSAVAHSPAKMKDFGEQTGVRIIGAYEELLGDPSIEAIILASPHSHHAQQIELAARAKKPVFVEKPLTLDGASARASVAACSAAGTVLCVGHNRRFLLAMKRLQELCDGELGTILHYECNFSAAGGLGYEAGAWRANPAESPGGGMTGLGIHMLDAIISFGGKFKSTFVASTRRVLNVPLDDTVSAIYEMADGSIATLNTMIATAPCFRIQIYGTKGWARLDGHEHLTIAKINAGTDPIVEMFERADIERAELEAFAEAVSGRARYPVSAAEAIHGIDTLEATIKASKCGKRVMVEPLAEDMAREAT